LIHGRTADDTFSRGFVSRLQTRFISDSKDFLATGQPIEADHVHGLIEQHFQVPSPIIDHASAASLNVPMVDQQSRSCNFQD
jgi:hypothetical protein